MAIRTRLQSVGLTNRHHDSRVDSDKQYDLNFLTKTGGELESRVSQAKFTHIIRSALVTLRSKLLNDELGNAPPKDLLLISTDPLITLLARSAGWETLFLIGKEHMRSGDFEYLRGGVSRLETTAMYTKLSRIKRHVSEDIVYDLRDGHHWRPSNLR